MAEHSAVRASRWHSRRLWIVGAAWLLLLTGSYLFPVWMVEVYPGLPKGVPVEKRLGRCFRFAPPTVSPEFVESATNVLARDYAKADLKPYTSVRPIPQRFEVEALVITCAALVALLLLRILAWRTKRGRAGEGSQINER